MTEYADQVLDDHFQGLKDRAARDEREQCCKDICEKCGEGWKITRIPDNGWWYHVDETSGKRVVADCEAYKIRERAWQQESTNIAERAEFGDSTKPEKRAIRAESTINSERTFR